MEKKQEISIARKRRAKLLAEQRRTGWTATKLGHKYKVTPQRMSQLLRMAATETNNG
jgi:predicted 3-demethylubiquinone-9 3-methyltransferase (glyoxalase superfamily)